MDTDVPPILLPCAICARTFMPQSLEKHTRICEQAANKKRKPFDSSKQRIQGTELAEFVPRLEKRRYTVDDRTGNKSTSTWKQTHDDFLRQIRAARNEIVDGTMQKQGTTVLSSSAPTRANEQGVCPTCNRHFGIKAYDRHVAWCKDRITRVPVSPATNIAKERLEARMKYRAPSLKNRRQITREKYSPNSATNLSSNNKTSPTQSVSRVKESVSAPNCNKNNVSPMKHKPTITRRSGQSKDTSSPIGPMKSRPVDRTNWNLTLPLHPVWSNYVRRRPDFNLVLSSRTGKDYNPFLLAEQQMNDLLSDASEQSVTDNPLGENRETSFPLSHSSAFVKYPYQSPSNPSKRSSLIAPPSEFDDLMSDFSSDSTETNSLYREVFINDVKGSKSDTEKKSPARELGRRVIIDKSKALGGNVLEGVARGSRSFVASSERARKILDKVSPKVVRPTVNRSFSVRASSAPKTSLDKKNSNSSNEPKKSSNRHNDSQSSLNNSLNNRNNNYTNLSSSNLSLSSIVSSDVDIKRSNSVFDELMTSFEDENDSFTSLKSLLKNDSLSMSSSVHGRQRHDQISDEELSSPESHKRQDHGKFSGDSAYSSLNRKYLHHGRSTNDVGGRLDEDPSRQNRDRSDGDGISTSAKFKMSKFCHECGSKFPKTAKFCCECGIRRLVL
ncbi:PREDICTED: homeobox protein 2-like [Dufourea novaeangliae]|uniref:homeobox protein 2-like n=1 Tax=Dufourea novaeangliae TaxID=178035 RepID=UPI000767B970|nr:PREDICTED: homeobox protein 2-like [Dufourea novaeangliae]